MSAYTCNTCELQFSSSQAQREHMKSDWHRYNLKRRVAHLSPITEELFNSKVQAVSIQKAETESSESKKQMTKKEARRREKEALLEKKRALLKLAEQNALKKMREQAVPQEEEEPKVEEPNLAENLTEEELAEKLMQQKIDNKVDIPLNECFFCTKSRQSKTVEENLDHMFKNHGFYIPEQKYLTDRDGLLEYISEKIGLGNICIVCNFQGRTLEAVKAHMLAKRHCRIPYEEEDEKLEVSQFYDFSSTYKQDQVVATAETDEQGWEDIGSDDEEPSDDEDLPQDYIYHDGVELHLPTGIKVGHRSLQRYYRQNLRPEIELTEGQGTLVAAETRSFLTSFDRKQVQVQQRVWQTEVKDKKRHDKRAAKFINNQPHYRDQLLQ